MIATALPYMTSIRCLAAWPSIPAGGIDLEKPTSRPASLTRFLQVSVPFLRPNGPYGRTSLRRCEARQQESPSTPSNRETLSIGPATLDFDGG